MRNEKFDRAYFERYYGAHPIHSVNEIAHLATPVRSVLEVGAGVGDWSNWYRTLHPTVRVTSTDVSEHACATFGHERRDIAQWAPKRPFDLVICTDVLQYLDDRAATRALRNLTTATRTCLYFDALTSFDAKHTVEQSKTDFNATLRTGEWYRQRLSRGFTQAGAGLWVRKSSTVVLHELERHR